MTDKQTQAAHLIGRMNDEVRDQLRAIADPCPNAFPDGSVLVTYEAHRFSLEVFRDLINEYGEPADPRIDETKETEDA